MSRSFAVWGCRNYNENTDNDYNSRHVEFINELHVNFWNINSKKFYHLDFGISFKKPSDDGISQNGAICLFVPFKKTKIDFIDLSSNLEQSRDLVTAVFNEYLIKSEHLSEKHLKLELTRKDNLIINTKLDFGGGLLDHRVNISAVNDGTLIIFKLKHCLSKETENENENDHYIRFRINLNKEDSKKIVKTFYPNDLFLKSNIERSDIIDFRINEQRNLPNEISTTLASASCTPNKYHFFIIRDMVDECSASGSNYQGCRILESETWNKYFVDTISFGKNDPMIYHWKITKDQNSRLNDFSVVVKFKNTKSKFSKIFAYLFYASALTYAMKFISIGSTYKNQLLSLTLVLILIYIITHFIKFRK